MCERDTFGGAPPTLAARPRAAGVLVGETPLGVGGERRRTEAEVAVALGGEPLAQPAGGLLHAPVLGEPPRELLGRLLRLEIGELGLLLGEQVACLQLEQRGDEDEELAARIEVELVALGQALDERDDDAAMSISAGWSAP